MNLFKKNSLPLYLKILIGMIAGILLGFLALQLDAEQFIRHYIHPWGKLFIRLLQLVAVPLVFVSLVKGIAGLEEIRKFSTVGVKTLVIYTFTTLVAILVGLGLGLLIKPGELVDRQQVTHLQEQYLQVTEEKAMQAKQTHDEGPLAFFDDIVPNNFLSAASDNGKMLQVIFFSILFGAALLSVPEEKTRPVVRFFDALNDIILKMVDFIILFAPLGVAALMAGLITDFRGEVTIFTSLLLYALTVIVGLFLLLLLFYPLLVSLFTRISPIKFIRAMYPVQLFGFTTSSSAATLPLTLKVVEGELGVKRDLASFVLPIGCTINMDGTACYQTIAILFIAQVLGIELTFLQLATVVGMTVLSSIGTPAVPGGSYVVLTMVLTAVGIPAEGLALILGIDRPLDMLRTSVNVTGDATVVAMLDR
ncbi:MAG: dicarboxylate/amino acid:cation symporter [Mediterranea massiliensis]|nr:dicarboxylate/amino acid:cation symporter [Mediterranea massiliensis]